MGAGLRFTEDQARVIIERLNRVSGRPMPTSFVPATPFKKRKGTNRGPSELELIFAQQLAVLALPNPKREYVFIDDRKFRLDFAWPDEKIAVEVQGMVHRIKGRFHADIEKRALALLAGWRVLEVGGAEIRAGIAAAWLVTLWEKKR